jgi:hypothetical protein
MSLVQVAVVPPFRPRQFHWYLVDESAVSKSVPVRHWLTVVEQDPLVGGGCGRW